MVLMEFFKKKIEQRIAEWLNRLPGIIVELDSDGKVQFINQRGVEMLGYLKGELVGRDWFQTVIPPIDRERLSEEFKKYLSKKEGFYTRFPASLQKRDGNLVHILWENVILEEERRVKGVLGFGIDISPRVKQANYIQRREEFVAELLDKLPVGIYIVNSLGIVEYANEAMAEISGIPKDRFVGIDTLNLPTYKEIGVSEAIAKALEGEPFSIGPIEYTSYYAHKTTVRKFIGLPFRRRKEEKKVLVIVEDFTDVRKGDVIFRKIGECVTGFSTNPIENIQRVIETLGAIGEGESFYLRKVGDDVECVAVSGTIRESIKKRNLKELFKKFTSGEESFAEDGGKCYFYIVNLKGNPVGIVVMVTGEESYAEQVINILGKAIEMEEVRTETNRELRERITELEKFQEITIGREERIMELKQQVKELEERLKALTERRESV